MSEVEDFEVDEDCLRDIEEQEELFFTQTTQTTNENNLFLKRQRSESPPLNDNVNSDHKPSDASSKKLCLTLESANDAKSVQKLSSNKNLLLSILMPEQPSKSGNQQIKSTSISRPPNNTCVHSKVHSPSHSPKNIKSDDLKDDKSKNDEKISPRNLLLNILQSDFPLPGNKNNDELTPLSSIPSNSCVNKPPIYHESQKNHVNDLLLSRNKVTLNAIPGKSSDNIQRKANNQRFILPNNKFNSPYSKDSHRNDINTHLNRNFNQKNCENNVKNFKKSPRRSTSPTFASPDLTLLKTVVRKFPGPAGLLPDNLEDDPESSAKNAKLIEAIKNYNDENLNINRKSPSSSSSISDVCSQDTKKLFCDGAWQLMLNDLPNDRLKGCEIAAIKRSRKLKKISLLGATIHQIDLTTEHPRVILKDISDSIEGIMHKDIFMKYENVLRTGVVILLKDVGLLNYQGAQKFSSTSLVMITPKSIIAMYSETSRIVSTPDFNIIAKYSNANAKSSLENNHGEALSSRGKLLKSLENVYETNSSGEYKENVDEMNLKNGDEVENLDDNNFIDLDNDDFSINFNVDESFSSLEDNKNNNKAEEKLQIVNDNLNNEEDNSINLAESEANKSDNASEHQMSSGFADHLFDDDSCDAEDADQIISQLDVEAIQNNFGPI